MGASIDLFVQVRLPDSPVLGLVNWPRKRKPAAVDQASSDAALPFPVEPRTSALLPAMIRARVVAPGFQIEGASEKTLEVPPHEDSRLLSFLLTPTRPGDQRLDVEIYSLARDYLGTIGVETTVDGQTTGTAVNVGHLVLTVKVEGGSAPVEFRPSPPDPHRSEAGNARALWQQKLDFYREQEAITSDPARLFELRNLIQAAQVKVAELSDRGREFSLGTAPVLPPAPPQLPPQEAAPPSFTMFHTQPAQPSASASPPPTRPEQMIQAKRRPPPPPDDPGIAASARLPGDVPPALAADSRPSAPPRVFLSYSWDSDEQKARVLALAERLRKEGVDAWLDRYTSFPDKGWSRWMEDEIERAQFVVVVATAKYAQRFAGNAPSGVGLGATWEGAIITQDLYEAATRNTKFLPTVFDSADLGDIPKPLRAYTHFRLDTEAGYDALYRHLTGQPEIEPGALGERRELPPTRHTTPLPTPPTHEPTAAPSALHQLPPRPDLTGRDGVLANLESFIAYGPAANAADSGGTLRHSALQGMGGVGKTALAVTLAHRLKSSWPDAQLFVDLRGADPQNRPPVSPAEAMAGIIHTFHPTAPLPEDVESLAPIYRSTLAAAGRVLLLLDDAVDAAQVEGLLPPENCLLLVTSRHQFDLPGVAARSLEGLSPDQSRALLLKRAPRLGNNAAEAAELCGHLPLALRVFAGAVNEKKLTPVPDLLTRLRTRQHRLTKVEAAFALSEEQLPDALRRRWHLLSIFPASFTLEAAAAVWEEPDLDVARESMETLVNASLVEWNESSARFRLHDLMRQFCAEKLPAPDTAAARFRHARYYISVSKLTNKLYLQGGDSVARGLALFDAERAHLDAAFDWLTALTTSEAAAALLSLVNAVVYTGSLRFHPREHIRWIEAQRKAASLTGNRQAEGNALGNLGLAYAALGETRRAIELHEQALAVSREIGDRQGEGSALGNLGLAYAALGETRRAIELYEQRLVIAREIGDRRGEGNALGNLGNAYAALGETRRAIELYEQRLVIAREIGDRHGEGNALGNLGNAYAALGETRRAIELYEQRLVIAREIGDRHGEGNALGNLGNAYADLGEPRRAIELYEQRLVIAREIGDRHGEANALFNSAFELRSLGNHQDAVERVAAALAILEAIESPRAAKARSILAQWQAETAS